MSITVSVDVGGVDVDVDLDDFGDDCLANELESRGYVVVHKDEIDVQQVSFKKEERDELLKLIDSVNPPIASYLYNVREALVWNVE